MKTIKVILSLLVFVFLGYSCKKIVEKPGPDPITNVDFEMMRISKPEWLIFKVDASGTDLWKIPGIIETCMKDDTYRFYKDSILTTFENTNKCSGNPDSSQSNWKFIDGRKRIEATLFGNTDTADVKLLTDSTMQLFVNYNGMDATIFFKKK